MKITPEDWMLLKLAMTKKNSDLELMMDKYLEERCSDYLRQLRHDVDCCSDPKSFYEKEIPYRMENFATADMRHLTQMISNSYGNNLYWLQTNLRHYGITKFELPFTEHTLRSGDHKQFPLNLLDIHKTRLYTRAGTLITALCLSGFSAGIFVGSLLIGAASEELLLSHSKKSKKIIIGTLPDIVNNYKSQMRLHIVETLNGPCTTIINALNNINYERNELH